MPGFAIPIGIALVAIATGTAEAQRCLHGSDEAEAERTRRRAAVAFMRVNAAETQLQRDRGTYVALVDAVSMADVPVGFVPRLTFDRWSYMVSLKDTFDPCGFRLFSAQDGVIYEAQPSARVGDESRQEPSVAAPDSIDP
jgi:hypothetical protein